jgi:hypothetical protein
MDTLQRFNQQVLRYQDEAYTLACYLLGNDSEAVAVTQQAVANTYRLCPKAGINCRLLLFRQVCRLSRAARPAGQVFAGLPWRMNSFSIAAHERMALILVDVLGLDYRQTAAVLALPVDNVSRLLAGARRKLGTEDAPPPRG